MLLDFLASHLSQAGDGNFKKATWNATAAHMVHNYPPGPDNGDKTAESCEWKFKVLKKSYYAITDLKSVASGFAYDDEHGVMVLLDNANLWDCHFARNFVFSHSHALTCQALALVLPTIFMLGLKIPCRGSPEAPSFSGHPEDLQFYFDDIIDFCDGFGLSDGPERIRFALKYAPFESADLWSHFVSSSQGDWARFTSEITQQYSELQEITRNKFYKLRKALASSDTISTSSLGEYYRIFRRLSLSLEKEHGPLPHLTSSFFHGFPPEFRQELLEFHDPPAQTFTVPSLIAAAGRVLALGNGLWKSRKVDSSRAQPSRASDNHSPHRLYSFCFFCGLSGHVRAGCHSFKSYLALGKCLLVDGRVVLPTGLEIPREVAGRTLRDRLDNWSLLTSRFEARMGSSPARSLSPTAAPSRSVFNAPSHIPAQTSIVSTRSLPTLQLEPVVPDPPVIRSRRSSAERSRSSPHAQPQSRWPCGRGQSPLRPRSHSRSRTRTASYTRSKDEFIPVQSYARSSKQYHPQRRSYS
ncbi:hypothetical protein F5J12DRAFT_895534 [Pisolithus orientalis]|uniref:uncharacterized protein n=1 Tax=Pisolithus orientalis TaxID=936130 RepID=UPI002224FB58|nr:uncharacterized protein F5J12DRAFT_895534 [Pisolithus orientalis]KAI5998335.1 hypothetical protein F5J12DRAFT_895534 [Pisolithus orientalis]